MLPDDIEVALLGQTVQWLNDNPDVKIWNSNDGLFSSQSAFNLIKNEAGQGILTDWKWMDLENAL